MASNLKKVISYYDQTRWDYRWVWGSRKNYAIHYGYYDEEANCHEEAVGQMNRKMAEKIAISPQDKVLDAGCGVGGSAIWLARNIGCQVSGISIVEKQIDDAQKNAAKEKLTDLCHFEIANYLKTPFPNESFDVVWAQESLCHAPSKYDFYQEAFRLLKAGGRIVISEYIRKQRPLENKEEKGLLDWLNNWAIPDIDTINEHRENAIKAGFKEFDFRDITSNTRQSLYNSYVHANRWYPTARFLARIGVFSPVKLNNVLGTKHMYGSLQKDSWFFSLMSAIKKA